jgi:hypothetical protein
MSAESGRSGNNSWRSWSWTVRHARLVVYARAIGGGTLKIVSRRHWGRKRRS